MNNLFQQYRFKYSFRDYQKRVLDEAHTYMDDNKINIVAAPGAGKTILALQFMLEWGEPTLILSPTIALREQWIERFTKDFTNGENLDEIISCDIKSPKLITSVTYQSLYSAYSMNMKKNQQSELVDALKSCNIKVIILDEAHHLKTAWLEAVNDLIVKLGNIRTLSLTATPPYDVKAMLWNKYIGLCGEIDIEVTVPELVEKHDLAPHQDFIYFNYPTKEQVIEIGKYGENVNRIFSELLHSEKMINAISLHSGIIDLETRMDYFEDHFQYYITMLKFLNLNNIGIPQSNFTVLNKYMPKSLASDFSIDDMETLLTYCLFWDSKSYKEFDEFFRGIKHKLNVIGAIIDGQVSLRYTKSIKTLITQNIGKLNSVKDIVKHEKDNLGEKLKLVVIADNIFKDALDLWDDENFKLIGVIPVFVNLVKSTNEKVIVLTGEIVIIPSYLETDLIELCKNAGMEKNDVSVEELSFNFDYAKVSFTGTNKRNTVSVITQLFEVSDVNVLVGSNALIGEGWDAPFVNTLIMASAIASFVSSNQIRGRAIRTYKQDKNKCANIWHLVCVEKGFPEGFELGEDFNVLKRRFEAFEAIRIDTKQIDYGIDRMNITEKTYSEKELEELNHKMISVSKNRSDMKDWWTQSLVNYTPIKKTKIDAILDVDINAAIRTRIGKKNAVIIDALMGFNDLLFAPVSRIFGKNPVMSFSLKHSQPYKIGNAVLKTLIYMKEINPAAKLIFLKKSGKIVFYLQNAILKENNIFTAAFSEILHNVDNPRYIIIKNKNYYQVPTIIGKNKKYAQYLMLKLFGRKGSTLVFMRNPKGKRELFRIRLQQSGIVIKWKENKQSIVDDDSLIGTKINLQVLRDELETKNLYRK